MDKQEIEVPERVLSHLAAMTGSWPGTLERVLEFEEIGVDVHCRLRDLESAWDVGFEAFRSLFDNYLGAPPAVVVWRIKPEAAAKQVLRVARYSQDGPHVEGHTLSRFRALPGEFCALKFYCRVWAHSEQGNNFIRRRHVLYLS